MPENYIAIGDIHGRYDLLAILLDMISNLVMNGTHKVIFLGDYVDRGPDSFSVLSRIKGMHEAGSAIALRGNHEDMMLEYLEAEFHNPYSNWLNNGARATIDSYLEHWNAKGLGRDKIRARMKAHPHYAWLKSLPLYYETDKIWASHAPIPLRKYRKSDFYRIDVDALTWSWNGNFNVSEDEFAMDHGKLAVCGHVHRLQEGISDIRIYPNIIYCDSGSGCASFGRLTGVIIEDGKYVDKIQVNPLTIAPVMPSVGGAHS